MKSVVCHELLMPQGSHFSCFAKKSNQKKATPTFALIRDLQRKRRTIRNSLRSNNGPTHHPNARRLHSKSRGRIHGNPPNQFLIASRWGLGNPDASIWATLATLAGKAWPSPAVCTVFFLLVCLCAAIPVAVAQSTNDFPNAMTCHAAANLDECASGYARKFSAEHPGLVKRTRGSIEVRLDNGTTKRLRGDCADCVTAIALHASSRILLIREQFSEGNTWHLLNLSSGEFKDVGGFPLFSHDSAYVFVWSGLDESEYTQPVAALFAIDAGTLRLVWRGETVKRMKGRVVQVFGVASPKWTGTDAVSFLKTRWRKTASSGQIADSEMTVTKRGDAWEASERKLSERSRDSRIKPSL